MSVHDFSVRTADGGADPLHAYLRQQAPGDFGPEHGFVYEHARADSRGRRRPARAGCVKP